METIRADLLGTCPVPASQLRPHPARPWQRRPIDHRPDPVACSCPLSTMMCWRPSKIRRPFAWTGSDSGTKGPRIAFTTDSFVVRPIFFPGGDIGRLAVHGTVNDLAVGGARPLFLSAAFILEEGWP